MKFLCLAYGREADWKKLTKAEQDALLRNDDVLRQRGDFVSPVQPAVTTVTAWDGTARTTTEPFSPLRAPLAGFSIIEADSVEHVVQLVKDTPCARAGGAIEIRPLMHAAAG